MQKIFTKYLIGMIIVSMIILLVLSYFLSGKIFRIYQENEFRMKLNHIAETIKENEKERNNINALMENRYLTSVRMLDFLLENDPVQLYSPDKAAKMAKLLAVDEINITDGRGIIRYSSRKENIGFSFKSGSQAAAFMVLLDKNNKKSSIIQDIMPNTYNHKLMKYIAVPRSDKKGIVQVGIIASRFYNAERKNTYKYIFGHMLIDNNENFFAIDNTNGSIIGNTDMIYRGKNISEWGYSRGNLLKYQNGGFAYINGIEKFIMTKKYNNLILGAEISENIFQYRQFIVTGFIFLFLIMISFIVILSIRYLVKKKIIDGIHNIVSDLDGIKDGHWLDKNLILENPELNELSKKIYSIINYILSANECFIRMLNLTEIPLAAFRCQNNDIIVTSKFFYILGINEIEKRKIISDEKAFVALLISLQKKHVENDVYKSNSSYIKLIMRKTKEGVYGIIIDVTKDMLEKRKIYYENRHDALTGLNTYQYFHDCVENILYSSKNKFIALIMMDIDKFKTINDTKGHDAGDLYIQHVADFMRDMPRRHAVLCRRSGDEFCICLYDYVSKTEIRQQIKKLWYTIGNTPFQVADEICYLSVSGGIAWFNAADNFTQAMANADKALYHAKNTVRGSYQEYVPVDE
ncbi:GGDEF domain-containing protein [Pectinatus sottacetonis]|uniref:GGDEF domain-containing protein n=1 Tax=Pectinatus sottacetonis TaxID=1002795 RepID=UPI0018C72102|nr:GGDEF domain-containing protein [Pectinatus sottacetonis]